MKNKLVKVIANIRVGKPAVAPDAPSHVKGVRQGNKPGSFEKEEGIVWEEDAGPDTGGRDEGGMAVATARRSTGITPENSEPIDPDMPTLTPP